VKRIVSLGLAGLVGAALGCSNSVKDEQPKNANPNAVGRVHRATVNGTGSGDNKGGGASKTAGAIND
jgi:hypothetical protein